MNHAATVTCPECGRPWTGYFPEDKTPEEAVCKDCAAKKEKA